LRVFHFISFTVLLSLASPPLVHPVASLPQAAAVAGKATVASPVTLVSVLSQTIAVALL